MAPPKRRLMSVMVMVNSSQLNTTYSVEGEGGGDGPYAEPLPQPRFVDDFVDSWVHAASSCSSRDSEADGLYALEPEPDFCVGASSAPHSSELNLYHPHTPAPATPPQADPCMPCAIDAVEPDAACIQTIPAECDVSRPPPPLPPPLDIGWLLG
ncbi:hypothetical protein EVAR_58212_1 [Eumeta japonica]|uniref:Uncharacterized protein n=1 Tax=Eumeta variegata TaxID=151549 RepID=A0A4C1YU42_EUMVA|nr:hypothetical protein EVAR_58212_1 [Eumeta japonica]